MKKNKHKEEHFYNNIHDGETPTDPENTPYYLQWPKMGWPRKPADGQNTK